MSLNLIVLAIVMSAFGAGVRYALMEHARVSVVWVNALSSFVIGACIAWFGLAVSAEPIEHTGAWASFGFLAGFSTVSGQVAWVYQQSRNNWYRLGVVFGLIGMAAGVGALGYGAMLWLL